MAEDKNLCSRCSTECANVCVGSETARFVRDGEADELDRRLRLCGGAMLSSMHFNDGM
jgi:hypothetical protein